MLQLDIFLCNCKPFPVGIRDYYHKLKSHNITRRVRTAAKIALLSRNVDLHGKYYVHAFTPLDSKELGGAGCDCKKHHGPLASPFESDTMPWPEF